MSVENEPIIPVQVKYIEVQSATVLRNEKISSPRKIHGARGQNGQSTLLHNGHCQSPVAAEDIQVSHGTPVMSPCAGSPTNPLIPNKFQFDPNLTYAEKVAHEMIVTEKIYLENLKQIIDVSMLMNHFTKNDAILNYWSYMYLQYTIRQGELKLAERERDSKQTR